MYSIRRFYINKDKELLDKLSLESGRVYSKTVSTFWKLVNKKRLWLKQNSIKKFINSNKLHAHSADAPVESFFNSMKSWRELRKSNPKANPPKKTRKFYPVVWKNSAIRLKGNKLILSNGKITEPLIIDWKFPEIPIQVSLRWSNGTYELICYYKHQDVNQEISQENPVGVDLGQIHVLATSEGTLLNGRLLRSLKQGRERSKSILQSRMDKKIKGSNRWKKLNNAKKRLSRKIRNKTKDILHKYTTGITLYLKNKGYNVLAVGDLTGYRKENNNGSTRNQENHSWLYSKINWNLKYKWKKMGLKYVEQEESYSSKTCLKCGKLNDVKNRNYKCKCGFEGHRDLIGSINILRKYLGTFGKIIFPVDGFMAHPLGVRYKPHIHVAHGFNL